MEFRNEMMEFSEMMEFRKEMMEFRNEIMEFSKEGLSLIEFIQLKEEQNCHKILSL